MYLNLKNHAIKGWFSDPEPDILPIGRQIRKQRYREGMSLMTLAKRSDVAESYICRLERGLVVKPDTVKVNKIWRALGLGCDYLK